MRWRLRAAGAASNDQVFGLAGTGAMDETRLLAILQRLPEGFTEIYLHPATRNGLTPAMHAYRHRDELDALLSPRVREAVRACGAATGGFRTLAGAGGEPRRTRCAA